MDQRNDDRQYGWQGVYGGENASWGGWYRSWKGGKGGHGARKGGKGGYAVDS
ncbi:hypothetical protein [Halalkalibacter alkaliphilus]|uniref:Uncharacterized protein n=1 Tax=Halalkalibacter alkaliphilus TaxID=2917993 RepID=A0A9X2CWK5_9BACI|nr:hypothetical protein [Halalkalibacter alkaliphilus]MCL7749566.1 hypothetical protein [Halalkalibacter alkaliphilus]